MKRFLIFIIPFFLISCITIKYQKVFDEIFEDAGKNSSEIKKAIHYFQNSGNYLQLNSLYYLLENTNGHSYVEYGAISANNDTLQYELENFSTYLEAKAAWDSLESEYGKLNWQPTKEIRDIKIISSKYLIENVELAYEVWKNKPWSKKYSFNVFLEYILPYRVDDEPTAKWRRFFLQQFQGLEKEMQNPYDSIEAANLINNKLKSWWDYDEKYSLDPNARSFMELLRTGEGSINDINIMILYALRANGIPSTLDFHISNLSFHNNTWIAVIDQEGNTIPIYNWQTDSKKLMEEKISPKVYRKSYRKQINNLTNIEKDEKLIPPELSGLHFFDVTPFYTDRKSVV